MTGVWMRPVQTIQFLHATPHPRVSRLKERETQSRASERQQRDCPSWHAAGFTLLSPAFGEGRARNPWRWLGAALTVLSLGSGILTAASADATRTLTLTYDFVQPQVELREGQARVTVSGCETLNRPGESCLPFRTARILLPPGFVVSTVTAEPIRPPVVLPGMWHLERGQWLASPRRADEPPARSGARVPAERSRAFANASRPTESAQSISVQRMLGCDIALVRLFPVEFQATTGQLRYSPRLNVTLTLTPSGAKPARPFPARGQASARERVASWVDNPALLSEYQMAQAANAPDAPSTYDYLLVTQSALVPSFQPLVEQKTRAGLSVKVETMEAITASQPGRDAPEKLRNFIRYACTNWGVQYVLLGGDVATVPCRHAYVRANEDEAECLLPTDVYLACLDGTWNRDGDKRWGESTDGDQGDDVDLLAEVWVGRAPVDTPAEAASFVAKTIRYEREGNRNSRSVLLAAGYLGRFAPDIAAQGGAMFDPLLPRLRECTVRWLDDRPHTTPQWDSREAIRALNQSPHFVLYNGHGERDAMMRLKAVDLGAVTNEDLFLAYSVGCHAGRFDNDPFSPDSIAEELVKRPGHGAFAAIFNARLGWFDPRRVWSYSGEFQVRFFEQLLDKGQIHLGKACQLAKHDLLGQVETRGLMPYRWCYFEITLFGDPHTSIQLAPAPLRRGMTSVPRGVAAVIDASSTVSGPIRVPPGGDSPPE